MNSSFSPKDEIWFLRVWHHISTGLSRNISGGGGKGGRCLGLTTLPPSRADFLETWELQPPGNLRACPDLSRPLPLKPYCSCYGDVVMYFWHHTGIAGWATHITKCSCCTRVNKFRLTSPLLGHFAYFCVPCICPALAWWWLFYGRNMQPLCNWYFINALILSYRGVVYLLYMLYFKMSCVYCC